MTKDELEQDNDTWQPLSLAARRLLVRLEEQRPDKERDTTPDEEIQKQRDHARFVETRLKEIDRFERRYRDNRA